MLFQNLLLLFVMLYERQNTEYFVICRQNCSKGAFLTENSLEKNQCLLLLSLTPFASVAELVFGLTFRRNIVLAFLLIIILVRVLVLPDLMQKW